MLLAFLGSPVQMLIALIVILLLFGRKLPETMRSLGKSVTEFQKGIKDDSDPPADPS